MQSCCLEKTIDDLKSLDWFMAPVKYSSASLGELLKSGIVETLHCDDQIGQYCTQNEHLNGSHVELLCDDGLEMFLMAYVTGDHKPFTLRLPTQQTSVQHYTIDMKNFANKNVSMSMVIKYAFVNTAQGLNFIAMNIDDKLQNIWLPSAKVNHVGNEIHVHNVKDVLIALKTKV